jgi:competence protein ComEA
MIVRVLVVAALVAAAAFALWRHAPHTAISALPAPGGAPSIEATERPRHSRLARHEADATSSELVVYVVGAVQRPGLYRLRAGDRYDRAVALAGGLRPDADAAGVDLAQRAADGEEVLVPRIGETTYRRSSRSGSRRSHRRHTAAAPAEGSVNVNGAGAEELARVPGVGRAIAARIVELRDREGAFASLDELLDVAGMTQSRLARARSYLQELGGAEGSPH